MKYFGSLLISVLIFVMSALAANAQSQRMALTAGTISVGGGGGSNVDAYCLDGYRKAPTGKIRNVVSISRSGATVTRVSDGQVKSLSDAMDSNWVYFQGLGVSYSPMFGQASA